ncbi:hypothetical protein M0657_007801 [Pyricularia oryzae]|uniref:Secreted protein n=2 Tax=Pyricularia oryzae TaxID=318829 RepID=A0AA97NNM0_PYRO3|nr:hypothetical protein OOU_Y34scaffold00927g28 [Pyricularia oryzae Y34]KAI7917255.1 hypothetical protein M9X92_007496 [Pyricularia oryzae]KAI7918062.1 hypothetical protein M0657_007801 [Pyricularia oryzae]
MKSTLICTAALLVFAKDVLAAKGDEKGHAQEDCNGKACESYGDWPPQSSEPGTVEGWPVYPSGYGPPQYPQYQAGPSQPPPERKKEEKRTICEISIKLWENKWEPPSGRRPGSWVVQWVDKPKRLAAVGVQRNLYGYWCTVGPACNVACAGVPVREKTIKYWAYGVYGTRLKELDPMQIAEAYTDDTGIEGVPGRDHRLPEGPGAQAMPWEDQARHLRDTKRLNPNFPHASSSSSTSQEPMPSASSFAFWSINMRPCTHSHGRWCSPLTLSLLCSQKATPGRQKRPRVKAAIKALFRLDKVKSKQHPPGVGHCSHCGECGNARHRQRFMLPDIEFDAPV